MAKLLVVVTFVTLFICLVAGGITHNHHHPPGSKHKQCHFQTEKASYDLRLLVREMNKQDWSMVDEKTQSTFFFNPCGGVHNPLCPEDSALCEITDKNAAISFGSSKDMTWAEAENGVELTYANGELCNNDVPRKTLVQMTCNEPTSDKTTQTSVITEIALDTCLVVIRIKSPYACPVEQLCTVFNKDQCESSEGLCNWSHHNNTCAISSTPCFRFGRHHLSAAAVVGIFASLGILFLCGLSLCVCACCIRRRRRERALLPTHKRSKTIKKKVPKKKVVEPVKEEEQENVIPMTEMPAPQYIYQPLNPYSGMPYSQGNPYGVMTKDGVMPCQFVQFIPQNPSIQNQ